MFFFAVKVTILETYNMAVEFITDEYDYIEFQCEFCAEESVFFYRDSSRCASLYDIKDSIAALHLSWTMCNDCNRGTKMAEPWVLDEVRR